VNIFYNSDGKIQHLSYPSSLEDKIQYIPHGTTHLYLDDNQYSYLFKKAFDYTIQDNIPIYTPVSDLIKLLPEQNQKVEYIKKQCNLDILYGFESSCTGEVHQYKYNLEYQANFNEQANILTLDSTITEIPWNTKDAGVINHSRDEFIILLKDANNFKTSKMNDYHSMKSTISNAKTTKEIIDLKWQSNREEEEE